MQVSHALVMLLGVTPNHCRSHTQGKCRDVTSAKARPHAGPSEPHVQLTQARVIGRSCQSRVPSTTETCHHGPDLVLPRVLTSSSSPSLRAH